MESSGARRRATRNWRHPGCRSCSAAIIALRIGSISAVARHCRERGRQLRVLWFDAHADFNTNELTPSGNIHGMPMAVLCGYGPTELIEIGGAVPAIASERRSARSAFAASIRAKSASSTSSASKCSTCATSTRWACGRRMEMALAGLDADTHLHVSFDVDFLDPDIAPGVGTTVAGGPSYREAQLCMEMIADTGRSRRST